MLADHLPDLTQPWEFRPAEVADGIRSGIAEILGPALGVGEHEGQAFIVMKAAAMEYGA